MTDRLVLLNERLNDCFEENIELYKKLREAYKVSEQKTEIIYELIAEIQRLQQMLGKCNDEKERQIRNRLYNQIIDTFIQSMNKSNKEN